MKVYEQTEDIVVIGIEVKTFPLGVKEAFGSLMKTLGGDRAYYGISWMDDDDNVKYYAMASEAFPGEGKPHNYESLTIGKGKYKAEALHDWMSKTDCIKDIFHDLMGNDKPNKKHPCIEWYQSDADMLCMIRAL
jgi:predicted transcriptional regulator YdeE